LSILKVEKGNWILPFFSTVVYYVLISYMSSLDENVKQTFYLSCFRTVLLFSTLHTSVGGFISAFSPNYLCLFQCCSVCRPHRTGWWTCVLVLVFGVCSCKTSWLDVYVFLFLDRWHSLGGFTCLGMLQHRFPLSKLFPYFVYYIENLKDD
jgi:hypothetical protein